MGFLVSELGFLNSERSSELEPISRCLYYGSKKNAAKRNGTFLFVASSVFFFGVFCCALNSKCMAQHMFIYDYYVLTQSNRQGQQDLKQSSLVWKFQPSL